MLHITKLMQMMTAKRFFSAFTNKVEEKLKKAFNPVFVQVQAADRVGDEQLQEEEYLNVKLVSEKFAGTGLLQRHQMVHEILSEEISKVHALNLALLTPEQWRSETKGDIPT